MFFMFFVIIANGAFSQGLHVSSGESFYVSPESHVFVGGDINVATTGTPGNLTITSDQAKSGSLIVAGNTPSGSITYKRYIDDTKWHLVAAPVVGQSISAFVADVANAVNVKETDKYAVAYYKNTNASGKRWVYHKTSASGGVANEAILTTFGNGKGYSANRTAAGTFSFKGAIATSDVAVPLATSGSGTHYWHAVGNPYPSFLPVNDAANIVNLISENSTVFDPSFAGLYVWDPNADSGNGAYTLINKAYSGAVYLTPGQAFLVKAKDNNQSFTFSEALQVQQNSADNFYKSSPVPSIVLSLSNGASKSTTTLKYFSNATTGLDIGYDGGAYQDAISNFSLDTHLVNNSKGVDFTLQCLPKDTYETLVVPLSVRAEANQELRFVADINNLPADIFVYIEDKVANTLHKINDAPYKVTPKMALNGVGRFYMHTASEALNISDVNDLNNIAIYKANNRTVKITGLQKGSATAVKMYAITGKKVLSKTLQAQTVNNIILPILSPGIYIVQVITASKVQAKKIIIE